MDIRNGLLGCCILFASIQSVFAFRQQDQNRLDQLLNQTKSENADERVDAVLKLVDFSEYPDQLIVPLVETMIGSDTRAGEAAQFVAEQLAKPLAEYCETALLSDDVRKVSAAAEMIHRLGNSAINCTANLVQLTKSEDPKRRQCGIYGLVNLKNNSEDVVQAVARFLDDSDFRNQVLACRAIVSIGPPAAGLSGKLKSLVETGNVSVRSHALMALGAIGPNTEFDVVELIAKHLDAFLQPDRDRALVALMMLGPQAISALEKVDQLLSDPAKDVQCQAALTRWKITGDAESTVKALVELSKSIDMEYEALHALYRMKEAASCAASTVGEHLQNEDGSIRSLAVEILENLGAEAKPWQAILEMMAAEDADPLVRLYCSRALKKMTPDSK